MTLHNVYQMLMEEMVESSWIEELEYDARRKDVIMTLNSGGIYRIKRVAPRLFKRWIASPSKGKFWHRHIKIKHRTIKEY